MNDLDHTQKTVGEWANTTFPQSNAASILAHLREEVEELVAAERDSFWMGEHPTEAIAKESADCLLLLLHLAHREGFSLFDAAQAKYAVNVGRTWETESGTKGYWKHVEATR